MAIPFTCPHCGKSMTVDDKFAGQTGPCSGCQQPITIPSSTGPSLGSGSSGYGLTVLGIGAACLLGCVVCAGVAGILLLPLRFGHAGAQKSASQNHLKQIAIAL